jgi:hypothetical protein
MLQLLNNHSTEAKVETDQFRDHLGTTLLRLAVMGPWSTQYSTGVVKK